MLCWLESRRRGPAARSLIGDSARQFLVRAISAAHSHVGIEMLQQHEDMPFFRQVLQQFGERSNPPATPQCQRWERSHGLFRVILCFVLRIDLTCLRGELFMETPLKLRTD